jgi:hypothetical protein
MRFFVFSSFYNALNRANIDALRSVVVAYTLHALDRVDHKNGIALGDRLHRTSRFASATTDTIV